MLMPISEQALPRYVYTGFRQKPFFVFVTIRTNGSAALSMEVNMKKITALLIVLCLILAGCSSGSASSGKPTEAPASEPTAEATPTELPATPTPEPTATPTPEPSPTPSPEELAAAYRSEIEFVDNTYVTMPRGYTDEITYPGSIEIFTYTAATEDGQEYEKTALAYLPYGYDANDSETKYNVLYLMHGGGSHEYNYFKGPGQELSLKKILDKMHEDGLCRPTIVVTPTYKNPFMDETSGSKNFYYELVNYLIPAFEGTHNTYLSDTSIEGIRASRLHRAAAGFSLGSCCEWSIFQHALDCVAYHIPVSGDCWTLDGGPDAIAQGLADIVNEGCGPDGFLIYAVAGGTGDVAYNKLKPQVEAMEKLTDTFKRCDNYHDGNFYYYLDILYGHSDSTVNAAVYNALPKFFRMDPEE